MLRTMPNFDDHTALLVLGEQAALIVLFEARDLLARCLDNRGFPERDRDVVKGPRDAGLSRILEAEVLDAVDDGRDGVEPVADDAVVHDAREHFLSNGRVHEWVIGWQYGVEYEAADRGLERFILKRRILGLAGYRQDAHFSAQVERIVITREECRIRRGVMNAPTLGSLNSLREPVGAERDVVRGGDDWQTASRLEDILVRAHDVLRFPLRLLREGDVHGHLVTVEVSVEGLAHERMEPDSVAFDELWAEGLDALAVERGRAVQKYVLTLYRLFEYLPHLGHAVFYQATGATNIEGKVSVQEARDDEGSEELKRHVFGEAAFVKFEIRAHHDDRAARIVHALAEQVLAEVSLLPFQIVGKRLQRSALCGRQGPGCGASLPDRVVEQSIDGFLEAALFVA